MALSRKRKKELDKLRSAAAELWGDQKSVLEHAGRVVRDATQQAAEVSREEVAPRLRDAAGSARDHVTHDVIPSVSSALSSAMTLLEVAKDARVKEAFAKVGKTGSELGARVGVTPAKSAGPGRYILIVVGLVAVAGVAYAAWQTLRADDELWVSDDSDDSEEPVTA